MSRGKGQGARVQGKKIIILMLAVAFSIAYCGSAYSVDDRAFLEGNYDKVVSDTTRLINARSSDSDELYYLRGLANLKLKRFDEARRDFNAILSGYPRSSRRFDAFMGIGDSYFLEGNIDDAIKSYEGMLSAFRDNSNIKLVYQRLDSCRNKPARFSVQVGSFRSKDNAEKLASKLSRDGYESFVDYTAAAADGMYRVKIGNFNSKNEAENMASGLRSRGYSTKICSGDAIH